MKSQLLFENTQLFPHKFQFLCISMGTATHSGKGELTMPSVLLSCNGREAAEYCNGASEADVMGAILALVQDYLQVSGLNAPLRPAKVPSAIAASIANRQRAQLLLCLQSYQKKDTRGAEICFHPGSEKSRRLAQLLEARLGTISPSGEVRLIPAPQLPDFRMARCPAVQLRPGCRDDHDDAQWMLQSTGVIAHAIAGAVAEWFELPLKSPFAEVQASVNAPGGCLALRSRPHSEGELLRPLPNGTKLTLLHREGEWQYVELDDSCGYVMRKFLRLPAEKT